MWIAGKRMKVKKANGSYAWVNPGDPVPEAEHWPNRAAWISEGYIRESHRGEMPTESVDVSAKKESPAPSPRPTQPAFPVKPKAKPEAKPDASVETPKAARKPASKPKPKPMRPKAKKANKLKGPGECPYCGKDFLKLERHKCKKAKR